MNSKTLDKKTHTATGKLSGTFLAITVVGLLYIYRYMRLVLKNEFCDNRTWNLFQMVCSYTEEATQCVNDQCSVYKFSNHGSAR